MKRDIKLMTNQDGRTTKHKQKRMLLDIADKNEGQKVLKLHIAENYSRYQKECFLKI